MNVIRTFDTSVQVGDAKWKREDVSHQIYFDTTKSKQILGLKYRSWEDTARTVMAYFREKGFYGA